MTRFWHELWPQVFAVGFVAGVLGNLTASALLGAPAVWSLHRKLDRHHAERMAQGEAHHQTVMAAVGETRGSRAAGHEGTVAAGEAGVADGVRRCPASGPAEGEA